MPSAAELPANTANWTIDPARAVLLVHDMQHYFLRPFPAESDPVIPLIARTAELVGASRDAGVPVAYTAQPGAMTPAQRGLLADFWGPGMGADPVDRDLVPALAPAEHEPVFTKWRASAFFKTPLLEFLRERDRDQLIITGVYAHVGILTTANEALAHDIRTFIVADATADFSPAHHRQALEYAATRCAMVVASATVRSALIGTPC
jgi:bifunctional isochorismate lyase/aryl carrier protein